MVNRLGANSVRWKFLNNQVHGKWSLMIKALWLGHATGISKIDQYFALFSFYDKQIGPWRGTVFSDIISHRAKLYVGTYNGLF